MPELIRSTNGESDEARTIASEVADLLDALRASDDREEMAALQEQVFDRAYRALLVAGGVAALYRLAPRFAASRLFLGSDWAEPARLQPGLARYALANPEGIGIECCSELRFLAIANGDASHPQVGPDEARRHLERVLALELESLFPADAGGSADGSADSARDRQATAVRNLFQFILDCLGVDGVMAHLVEEAERILLTRPIEIQRVRRMIDTAARTVAAWGRSEVAREAQLLVDALHGPTPLSRAEPDLEAYAEIFERMDDPALLLEADTMATSMRRTGLVCPHHAVLVRWASEHRPRVLVRALGIEQTGRVSMEEHWPLVRELIGEAVHPATAHCVYGLSRLLDRGVLFQSPVPPALRSLLQLEVLPEVAHALAASTGFEAPPPARSVLVAGVLAVLGQPRGVDQGDNPSCQSARAISLWAQNDPGYLLWLVTHAAQSGNVSMTFEGDRIDSRELEAGLCAELHPELDPVSLLLTPHLDRIYAEMGRRARDRDEDEHKWVNPEFHGWWVRRDFAALIDEMSGRITGADRFVRLFYAVFHPLYNGEREVMVPQPCGVVSTSIYGVFVDWHAIAIQRVDEDPEGGLRVYFYNPNHEKEQDWGQGIVTSTSDRGELEGESSLPFHQFASRVYVFHYDQNEQGDLDAIPQDEVERVLSLVREGWGAGFEWVDEGRSE